MWEKLDRLWQLSPAFRYLTPIVLVGVLLFLANGYTAINPPPPPPEPEPTPEETVEEIQENVLDGVKTASDIFRRGADLVGKAFEEAVKEMEQPKPATAEPAPAAEPAPEKVPDQAMPDGKPAAVTPG